MPRIGYTHIQVLLDRSGSMEDIKTDMEGGFNHFLAEQQAIPGYATIGLSQFDTEYDIVYSMLRLDDAPNLVLDPRNGTALHDALCKSVDELGRQLRTMPEHQRPDKVIFVIITDGAENSSKEFRIGDVNQRIKIQSDHYGWEFVFLGANQDAIAVGRSYGIKASNSMTYRPTPAGAANTYAALSTNVAATRSGVGGIDFTDEEREAANSS